MRRIGLFVCVGTLIIIFSAFTLLHTSGYVLATGSPHDGVTCLQCHTGTTGSVSVTVLPNPAFGPGNTYLPGATYTMSAMVSGSFALYGFDIELLNSNSSSGATNAGICGPAVSSNCQKVVFTSNPTNYTHTAPSGSGNAATFSFEWTAPSSGPVYIYCAGLGANGNNATSGDRVATYSVMLSPSIGIAEDNEELLSFNVSPNPVNEEVNCSYYLTTDADISVSLYDAQGRSVAELLKTRQHAGVQSQRLRMPEGLKAGFYFLKVSRNNKESVKKLLLYGSN